MDVARILILKARDNAQQSGLSATRRPDDRHELSIGDLKVDAAKHGHRPEGFRQADEFQPACH
jgi:hypothetical protein